MANGVKDLNMSDTLKRLTDDMKTAMKSGDRARLDVIRMLIADIKNAKINDTKEPGRDRTEGEVIQIISAYHKSISKTLGEFPPEKQTALKAELAVVDEYLPKKLSSEELKSAIQSELSQTQERNFGILMKQLQTKLGAQTDGKMLSETLKNLLS